MKSVNKLLGLSDYCCTVCEDEALKDRPPLESLCRSFIVCPECGNKRCPKASAHWQVCTNSNDVGQPGSFYGPSESWPMKSGEPK